MDIKTRGTTAGSPGSSVVGNPAETPAGAGQQQSPNPGATPPPASPPQTAPYLRPEPPTAQAAQGMQEAASAAGEGLKQAASQTRESLENFTSRAREGARSRLAESESYIRENPRQSALIAAGVGFLLAQLPLRFIIEGLLRVTLALLRPAAVLYAASRLIEDMNTPEKGGHPEADYP